jgi:peptide/nickel transport system permease protein
VLSYAIRRLFIAIPVAFAATFVTFLLVAFGTDPLSDLRARRPPVPAQTIAAERHRLWLDQNVFERYWHWLTNVFEHGYFGPAVQSNVHIRSELFSRLAITFRLVLLAMILAAILAVIVGVLSAVKQYSATDYTATFAGFLFLSLPTFWFALLLKQGGIVINRHVGHQVFYTIGDESIGLGGHWYNHIGNIFGHLILPTITLALISYAAWSRYNRASMLEVLNSDYIRLARAKGLSRRRVMIRHALRTALIPLTTVMALDLAAILGGAIVTETVFQWHGMGDFLLTSIRYHDAYAVTGWLLVTAFIVILFNLIADLMYGVLDPRIRYE